LLFAHVRDLNLVAECLRGSLVRSRARARARFSRLSLLFTSELSSATWTIGYSYVSVKCNFAALRSRERVVVVAIIHEILEDERGKGSFMLIKLCFLTESSVSHADIARSFHYLCISTIARVQRKIYGLQNWPYHLSFLCLALCLISKKFIAPSSQFYCENIRGDKLIGFSLSLSFLSLSLSLAKNSLLRSFRLIGPVFLGQENAEQLLNSIRAQLDGPSKFYNVSTDVPSESRWPNDTDKAIYGVSL